MKECALEWHRSYLVCNVAVLDAFDHPTFNLHQNALMGIWDFKLAWEQLENIAEEKDLWAALLKPLPVTSIRKSNLKKWMDF